jgi:hypothetical protein
MIEWIEMFKNEHMSVTDAECTATTAHNEERAAEPILLN